MSRTVEYTVPPECDGEKLIVFLRGYVKISARLLTKLKNDPNGLKRNSILIRTVDRVFAGDVISVTFPQETSEIPPTDTDGLVKVYEDDDILIINKSGDIAMHPTHNHQGDTLANKIAAYYKEKGKNIVFRAVGRLDKSTSGLVIIALNAHAANMLSSSVKKEYTAIVGGEYHGTGTINKPIVRPDPNKTYRQVGQGGDKAVTHWQAVATDGKKSIVKIRLETGRTHQIRVHFASEGTPLVGDEMYGSTDTALSRAALHCASVEFEHPVTQQKMFFEAELPEDMKKEADKIINNRLS